MVPHTPGPWSVYGPRKYSYVREDATGVIVAQITTRHPFIDEAVRYSNSCLIAAAPELLTELERALDHLKSWAELHPMDATTETHAIEHCGRTAIAKARGQ